MAIKEAIIPTGTASKTTERDHELKKLKDVLDRCGVVVTERKPSKQCDALRMHRTDSYAAGEFNSKSIQDDLLQLLNPASLPSSPDTVDASFTIGKIIWFCNLYHYAYFHTFPLSEQLNFPVAPSALSALVTYLSLLSDPSTRGAYTIRTHDLSQFMRLDASALRARNLTDAPSGMVRTIWKPIH